MATLKLVLSYTNWVTAWAHVWLGPENSGCLGWGESGGMGEEWGDFLAPTIRSTKNYSDYAMGAWAANREKGIRNYVYSLVCLRSPGNLRRWWSIRMIKSILRRIRLWTNLDIGAFIQLEKSGLRLSGLFYRTWLTNIDTRMTCSLLSLPKMDLFHLATSTAPIWKVLLFLSTETLWWCSKLFFSLFSL